MTDQEEELSITAQIEGIEVVIDRMEDDLHEVIARLQLLKIANGDVETTECNTQDLIDGLI